MEEITFNVLLGEYLQRKASTSLGERRAYNVIRGRNEKKKHRNEGADGADGVSHGQRRSALMDKL